jgi:hypothetical protein
VLRKEATVVRYRIKIALLGLGVLLGYGSALGHFYRGHGHAGSCVHDWDRETWQGSSKHGHE